MRQAVRGVAIIGGALMLLAGPSGGCRRSDPSGSAPYPCPREERLAPCEPPTAASSVGGERSGTPCSRARRPGMSATQLQGRERGRCARLGRAYANGSGVHKDDERAVAYYRKGCDRGSAEACTKLGFMLDRGRGVVADPSEALSYSRIRVANAATRTGAQTSAACTKPGTASRRINHSSRPLVSARVRRRRRGGYACSWASTTKRASACPRMRQRPSRFSAMPSRWVTPAVTRVSATCTRTAKARRET